MNEEIRKIFADFGKQGVPAAEKKYGKKELAIRRRIGGLKRWGKPIDKELSTLKRLTSSRG
jgi:hypothetical protein